jgi:hypothetical protein
MHINIKWAISKYGYILSFVTVVAMSKNVCGSILNHFFYSPLSSTSVRKPAETATAICDVLRFNIEGVCFFYD